MAICMFFHKYSYLPERSYNIGFGGYYRNTQACSNLFMSKPFVAAQGKYLFEISLQWVNRSFQELIQFAIFGLFLWAVIFCMKIFDQKSILEALKTFLRRVSITRLRESVYKYDEGLAIPASFSLFSQSFTKISWERSRASSGFWSNARRYHKPVANNCQKWF